MKNSEEQDWMFAVSLIGGWLVKQWGAPAKACHFRGGHFPSPIAVLSEPSGGLPTTSNSLLRKKHGQHSDLIPTSL